VTHGHRRLKSAARQLPELLRTDVGEPLAHGRMGCVRILLLRGKARERSGFDRAGHPDRLKLADDTLEGKA
jgi:hypothetical protein